MSFEFIKSFKYTHRLVAIAIFFSGLLDVFSVFSLYSFQKLMFLENIFPMQVIGLSRTLTLLIGVFLLFLAQGLWRGKKRSWWLSVLLILVSIVLHLIKGFNYEESLILLIPLLILILSRPLFVIESSKIEFRGAFKTVVIIFILILVYSFFGFYFFQNDFNHPVTSENIIIDYSYSIFGIGHEALVPITRPAKWFARSISVFGFGMSVFALIILFSPLATSSLPTEEEKKKVRQLVLKQGKNSTSYLCLMDDKRYFFSNDCVVAYKISNGVAMILGDPIGDDYKIIECVNSFIEKMKRMDLVVAFINVSSSHQFYPKMKMVKYGEEAIINTNNFSLEGSSMAKIRHSVSHVEREGAVYLWHTMNDLPYNLLVDFEYLYDNWFFGKKTPRLTFSLNFYPLPVESEAHILSVYSPDQKLWGVYTFYPYRSGHAMALDIMAKGKGAPNGLAEAAITEAIKHFKELGIEEISLGTAPLASIEDETGNIIEKGRELVFNKFNVLYNYKSLFSFKNQFNPLWEHRYLVYEKNSDISKIVLALISVHLKRG